MRYSLVTINAILLVVVIGFVTQRPANDRSVTPVSNVVANANDEEVVDPLDQLSSADIAVQLARTTKLEESTSVANKADTVNAQLSIAPADNIVAAKPQVIATGLKSRKDIQKYVVVAGDTVSAVASKFGVTSDTVRWSNGLTGDSVTAGKELIISPISGIVYKVVASDTIDSISTKYSVNKDQLIAFNDIEITGLPVGEYIVLPNATPPAAQPAARRATVGTTAGFAWGGNSAVYGGNGYDYGYCTWWAAVRRSQTGRPIPSNLGNASTWKILAQRAGLGVGGKPSAGAVIWTPPRDYYGHVGFVESVNPDGSVNISEMNTAGWGRVSNKTLSADDAARYSYIY